ncbi:CU044_5270 family protein [Spongiactinospora sp. TRM90649]|uniref:CU044_5270 family protein n=1 Tax=Spongiactinospora sp. TRM90649 TaxID=3031114 RepID=UPI0023F965ED|nr:CU044_5270 family protein [Spongiactinospora sp. TRM90649]MDF5755360.1 CU044_5270 family protein [Spongiactinospora sp. TRM90649]
MADRRVHDDDPRTGPIDDLRELRDLYGEPPPPAPAVAARVRGRLTAERRRRARIRLTWSMAAVGVATAAAVLAVTAPFRLPAQEPPPGQATARAVLGGRSILLAAATAAESGPGAPTGRYWHVERIRTRTHRERLGRGENRYTVVTSRVVELWTTADGRTWTGERDLGTRPKTPADKAAWARDGSPSSWPGTGLRVSPGAGRLTRVVPHAPFSMAGRDLTMAAIQRLPTDPAALRDQVVASLRESGPEAVDGLLADALSGLLWSKPSPPAVRAAAYRALAELSGVRYLGEITDERNRTGAGFAFTVNGPEATVRRTLIIDPDTSQVLSSADKGGDDRAELVVRAGWTSDPPAVPDPVPDAF